MANPERKTRFLGREWSRKDAVVATCIGVGLLGLAAGNLLVAGIGAVGAAALFSRNKQ